MLYHDRMVLRVRETWTRFKAIEKTTRENKIALYVRFKRDDGRNSVYIESNDRRTRKNVKENGRYRNDGRNYTDVYPEGLQNF